MGTKYNNIFLQSRKNIRKKIQKKFCRCIFFLTFAPKLKNNYDYIESYILVVAKLRTKSCEGVCSSLLDSIKKIYKHSQNEGGSTITVESLIFLLIIKTSNNMKSFLVDQNGFYGEFGGAYIPEILYKTVEDLKKAYLPIIESESFQSEFRTLLRDYAGRPSPLYFANRLSEKYNCKIYLKREDLNHTGAHKINNALGQVLLAKKMGKKRIIAETGAGQHGVATATVCALMNLPCRVYMGATDVKRQHMNVERMKMLGAEVSLPRHGCKTSKHHQRRNKMAT